MSALLELAERCEKATGADRELDIRIHVLLRGLLHITETHIVGLAKQEEWEDDEGDLVRGCASDGYVPNFTASLDASRSLCAEELPGWRALMKVGDNYASAQFTKGYGNRARWTTCVERPDDELPLALMAALLRAMASAETGEGT